MARNFQCELGGRYDHLVGRVCWVCRFGLCKPLGLSIATTLGQARWRGVVDTDAARAR